MHRQLQCSYEKDSYGDDFVQAEDIFPDWGQRARFSIPAAGQFGILGASGFVRTRCAAWMPIFLKWFRTFKDQSM
jgi:hypothetical protein